MIKQAPFACLRQQQEKLKYTELTIKVKTCPAMFYSRGVCPLMELVSPIQDLIHVTLGNIVGGGFFVATLYWFAYIRKSSPAA
jgi:formate/nitrite transporter FocA (FNT family)